MGGSEYGTGSESGGLADIGQSRHCSHTGPVGEPVTGPQKKGCTGPCPAGAYWWERWAASEVARGGMRCAGWLVGWPQGRSKASQRAARQAGKQVVRGNCGQASAARDMCSSRRVQRTKKGGVAGHCSTDLFPVE
jgi:hypothetical protein